MLLDVLFKYASKTWIQYTTRPAIYFTANFDLTVSFSIASILP